MLFSHKWAFSVFTLKLKKLESVTTLTRLFVIIKVKKCTPAEILFRYDSLAPGKARPRFRSKSLCPSDGCGSILCTRILSECAYHRAICRRGPFFFPSTANGGDVSPGVSTAEMSLFTAGFWQFFRPPGCVQWCTRRRLRSNLLPVVFWLVLCRQ